MASTNQGYEYKNAEMVFLAAKTPEERITALEEMIRTCPKHKSSEKMLANLNSRLVKLRKEQERKAKKKGKKVLAIKKTGDVIVCLVGMTNSGKSALLAKLTNAKPLVSELPFTTSKPEQGILDYGGCQMQIIELPSFRGLDADSENLGIIRMSDLIVIVAVSDTEINFVLEELKDARINIPSIVVHSKSDLVIRIPYQSKISVSSKTGQNIDKLRDMIFSKIKVIRVCTKEPGRPSEKRPVILKEGSAIRDFAAKVHKDFLKKFDYALVWGPSAKFPGQKCGLIHLLKDKDTVEMHMKK